MRVLLLCLLAVPGEALTPTRRFREDPAAGAQQRLKQEPEEAQTQLYLLYARYAETVSRRLEEGWRSGLLSGELVEQPEEAQLPARQLEEALRKRNRELRAMEGQIKAAGSRREGEKLLDRLEEKKAALRPLLRIDARSKGTCRDWSDQVWADLNKLAPEDWSISDETREARPYHTAAVACTPKEDPELCLVFDPWETGEPAVYEYKAWNEGSFETRLTADFFLHQLPEPKRAKRR